MLMTAPVPLQVHEDELSGNLFGKFFIIVLKLELEISVRNSSLTGFNDSNGNPFTYAVRYEFQIC